MSFGIIIDPKKKKKSGRVPIQADPHFRDIKKIGKEIVRMRQLGESRSRADRELGREVLKYTNHNRRG